MGWWITVDGGAVSSASVVRLSIHVYSNTVRLEAELNTSETVELAGDYLDAASAKEALRQLVNAVPVSDLI